MTWASTRRSRGRPDSRPPRCARRPRFAASDPRSRAGRTRRAADPATASTRYYERTASERLGSDDDEEVAMGRLIRLDDTGHTTLAEWSAADPAALEAAAGALSEHLERGMIASANRPDGTAEVVRELPGDAELVVLRRPIAGG